MRMPKSLAFPLLLLLMCCLPATAKNKNKVPLPADVLQARTVLVVIDPDAGMPIDAPNANNIARDDVEAAIQKWGRFTLVKDASTADLIITVRKGNGKIIDGTIAGIPNYGPSATDSGNPEDPSQRNPAMASDPTRRQSPGPGPQVGAGSGEDVMVVYRGSRDHALDSPAVWRYSAKDALQPPGVPAVEVFRKLIAEAEKQQAKTP